MALPYLRSRTFCYRLLFMAPRDAASFCRALSRTPESLRRESVERAIEQKKERLAALQLDLFTIRMKLATTEAGLEKAVRPAYLRLQRLWDHLRHIERQARLLRHDHLLARPAHHPTPTRPPAETRRQGSLGHAPGTGEESFDKRERRQVSRLRRAFIKLARQFHPDLAATSEQHLKRSALMAHINALYSAADETGLVALAEQLTQVDPASLSQATLSGEPGTVGAEAGDRQLERLAELVDQHESTLAELKKSERFGLMEAVEQHATGASEGRHPFVVVEEDIMAETRRLLAEMTASYRHVSHRVEQRRQSLAIHSRHPGASLVDSAAHAQPAEAGLMRLSRWALNHHRLSPAVEQLAEDLVARSTQQPALGRLLLLAYVAELAGGSLWGIETFDALESRLASAGRSDTHSVGLAEALLDADDLVAYGVSSDAAGLPVMQLSLRSGDIEKAMAKALAEFSMRRLLYDVLLHLGESIDCSGCRATVFSVPLFISRGLSDVRGLVCPRCARIARRYVLPKGRDIQAVLNQVYLDFDVIEAITVELGDVSISQQFLPEQMGRDTLAEVRQRLVEHVFGRHGLSVAPEQLRLCDADGTALPLETPLSRVAGSSLGAFWVGSEDDPTALQGLLQEARRLAQQSFGQGSRA